MSKNKPWKRYKKSRYFKAFRDVKQRFYIVCEGKTEQNYFDSFKLATAKIKAVDKKGKNALYLLNEALIEKDLHKDYDQYWLVFDKDEQTNSYEQIIEVFNKAKFNGLLTAFSNQCFELWYLLHFQNVSSAMSSEQLERKLDKYLPESKSGKYEKSDVYHYEKLLTHQKNALARASRLNFDDDKYQLAKINPSLTINHLVEELNQYII